MTAMSQEAGRPLRWDLVWVWLGPLGLLALAVTDPRLREFVSMAMEMIWTHQFTPLLGAIVYASVGILTVYLVATFLGSLIHRDMSTRAQAAGRPLRWNFIWVVLGALGLLALAVTDPQLGPLSGLLRPAVRLALGLGPFCFAAGFLTPLLVDRWSGGDPDRAGTAYAVNVVGCILGPLAAGFFLLPCLGERASLALLAALLLAGGLVPTLRPKVGASSADRLYRVHVVLAASFALAVTLGFRDYETRFSPCVIERDSTATVVAHGQGGGRRLLVNGVGMTALTPITKMMVHLPMTLLDPPPQNALVICFGMGTTFRAALSWGVPTTAVELVPSVPRLFGYFHDDAAVVSSASGARIVIDDGRRFLERGSERYDVITIDPPPPVEAAGSSLLYSREFYQLARTRLSNRGILQQWLPTADSTTSASVAKALAAEFPHVRVFRSVEGWGFHLLASAAEIPRLPASVLAARLPERAALDLVEWANPATAPIEFLGPVVASELSLEALVALDPEAPMLVDDRPVNEYFFLRRTWR